MITETTLKCRGGLLPARTAQPILWKWNVWPFPGGQQAAPTFLMVLLCSSLVFGFGNDNVGTSGAAFLKIAPSARPAGMGEAFTGVADDVSAVYWNPAGLGALKTTELTGMHMQYFQNIQYEFAAFARPTAHGTWALSVANLHTDDIDRRTEDSDAPVGQFSASDSVYWLSYGRMLTSRLALGANLKYVRQSLDEATAQAWATDAGALYETGWRSLRLGASVQNVGTRVKFNNESDPLPLTFRLGASMPASQERKILKHTLLSTDLLLPRDHEVGLALGTEYRRALSPALAFSVRGGYRTDSDVDGLKGVAAGGGMTFGRATVDFAWVPFGELGNSYRFGLHLKFGEPQAEQPVLQKVAKALPSGTDLNLESLLSLQ